MECFVLTLLLLSLPAIAGGAVLGGTGNTQGALVVYLLATVGMAFILGATVVTEDFIRSLTGQTEAASNLVVPLLFHCNMGLVTVLWFAGAGIGFAAVSGWKQFDH